MNPHDFLRKRPIGTAAQILVGAMLLSLGTSASAGEPVMVSCETSKLFVPDPAVSTRFGNALAIDGARMIAGQFWDNDLGVRSGSAHIYETGAGGRDWEHVVELHASEGGLDDVFGRAVDVAGDLVIVSSNQNSATGGILGSAYVFRREAESGAWPLDGVLVNSDQPSAGYFGYSVAISEDLALVGAPFDGDNGLWAGAIYAFRYDSNAQQWSEIAKLFPSDPREDQYFGLSIAIDGDVAAIGAPRDNDLGTYAGAVYIFEFDPRTMQWVEQEKLTASDTDVNDNFGWAVAMHGEELISGAPLAEVSAEATSGEGAAYVFRRRDDHWTQDAKLIASDGEVGDGFGLVADIRDGLAVLGVEPRRAIYVFQVEGGGATVTEDFKLTAFEDDPDTGFGSAVALAGATVLGGAPRDDELGTNTGSVLIFEGYEEDLNGNGVPDICESAPNDECAGAPLVPSGTTVFTNIVARTEGPPEPGCAEFQHDVWFKYIVPCAGIVTIDLCGSDFQPETAVYSNCLESGGTVIACSADGCAEPITFRSTPAVYRIRVGSAGGDRGEGSLTLSCIAIPGDLNADANVDVVDLLDLLAAWGPCPAPPDPCPADLDESGTIDIQDLLILLANWT